MSKHHGPIQLDPRRHLQRHASTPFTRLSRERKAQATRLLGTGMSAEVIADALRVNVWTIQRWLLTRQTGTQRPITRKQTPLLPREPRTLRPIVIVGGRAPWGGWWCPDCPTRCNDGAELAEHKRTHGGSH